MDWFRRLSAMPYVEIVFLTDNEGHVLRCSQFMSSQAELIASMIQSADVLGQSVVSEVEYGPMELIHITTRREHILIFPIGKSLLHLVVILEMSAPLLSFIERIEKIIAEIDVSSIIVPKLPSVFVAEPYDDEELNASELIEAVREWLQNKSGRDKS